MKYGYFQENTAEGIINRITAPINFTKIHLSTLKKFICYGTRDEILKWMMENENVVVESSSTISFPTISSTISSPTISSPTISSPTIYSPTIYSPTILSSTKNISDNNITFDLFADNKNSFSSTSFTMNNCHLSWLDNSNNNNNEKIMLEMRSTDPLMDLKYQPLRRIILKSGLKLGQISKLLLSLNNNKSLKEYSSSFLDIAALHNYNCFFEKSKLQLKKSKSKLKSKLRLNSILGDKNNKDDKEVKEVDHDEVGGGDDDNDDDNGDNDDYDDDGSDEDDVEDDEGQVTKAEKELEKSRKIFSEWFPKSNCIFRRFENSPIPPPGVLTPYNLELSESKIAEEFRKSNQIKIETERYKNDQELPKYENVNNDLLLERGSTIKGFKSL
ncbi:hypothetical protein Glove_242g103 [Diversispora epigaea]|uniref:Uncharacterized protein n=1 Tax=Diversispora epigaea TaxID=1348612 RepID=A0A397IFE9_9GLOM|nr:hypothetical protein Glove_242g103 [Diversispora epigaea]